jgi:hypothetical protein
MRGVPHGPLLSVEDRSSSHEAPRHRYQRPHADERDAQRVWLGALNFKKNSDERELLVETTEIVLRGSGYANQEEATTTAHRWRTVLELAFARRNIQADFGDRAPGGSFFFQAGIRILEQKSGRRVLNDAHALIVFECDPPPSFVDASAEMFVSVNATRLDQAVEAVLWPAQPRTVCPLISTAHPPSNHRPTLGSSCW